MYWSILHRTIFWELVRVFLLALVALTGVLLLGGIVAEASQRGLGPHQLLAVIPLLTRSTLPYTIPATTLFATCVVYGRLAADNEILAVNAAGIHLMQVIWPGLLLGTLVSAATFVLTLDVIPTSHHLLRTLFLEDVEEFLYSMLKREGSIRHSKINYAIYVNRVQGRELHDATFMRLNPQDQHYDIIARARKADLLVDMPRKQILVHMRHCYISTDNGADDGYVEDRVWPVELPNDFFPTGKSSARAMTWREIEENIEKLQSDRENSINDAATHQAVINTGKAPHNFAPHVHNLINHKRIIDGQLRLMFTELHMRPALALGCLCFVLVGCPVGIWFSRSDYLSAFITCFLPIVFLYYPLLLCGINFAKAGKVAPFAALWTANGLMAMIALVLFRKPLRT